MPSEPVENLLPRLESRREYFDYLDRWTVGTVDSLRAHVSPYALVKAFVLETSSRAGGRDAVAALQEAGQLAEPVDKDLFAVQSPVESDAWALVDVQDPRFPALYTVLDSEVATGRVNDLVHGSSTLDRVWIASAMFRELWQMVVAAYPDHRFSQMVFEHESVYERAFEQTAAVDDEDQEPTAEDDEAPLHAERRRARIQITERIGKLKRALPRMRDDYDPLESLVRLRIPAPSRGGHDVAFDGRIVNRGDSLTSFQQTVAAVTAIYRRSTERAELAAWPSGPEAATGEASHQSLSVGLPLLIKLNEELPLPTFERWVASFRHKRNRFRLWGNPISMGPGKVHLYAVDNHLWQPIDLEITRRHLYAQLPLGTCGNTIHRLVTNVQRFVDPKITAYIGRDRYESFISGPTPAPPPGSQARGE